MLEIAEQFIAEPIDLQKSLKLAVSENLISVERV